MYFTILHLELFEIAIFQPINHRTTINYAELNAIKLKLTTLINSDLMWQDYEFISILTDSLFTYNMLSIHGYPKLNYYYGLINEIHDLISQFNNLNIYINIIKVPSHTDIDGNDRADELAGEAADVAIFNMDHSENNVTWDHLATPTCVESLDLFSILRDYDKQQEQQAYQNKLDEHNIRKLDNLMGFKCDDIYSLKPNLEEIILNQLIQWQPNALKWMQ